MESKAPSKDNFFSYGKRRITVSLVGIKFKNEGGRVMGNVFGAERARTVTTSY